MKQNRYKGVRKVRESNRQAHGSYDINSPRLIHKRKIPWKCYVPKGFTCFLCGRGKGEWSVHFGVEEVLYKVVLCNGCQQLPVEVIAEGFIKD